jgi:curved DNA-binding protein CbpA
MSDVIHVDGSASTPCRVHDVIIVGESSSSTSSNTSRPATTDQIAAIAKQAAAVAGVSQFEVASAILKPPAAAHTKNLQPTLDGVVTCTTHAFLQDKSHSAVTKAGQKTAQKRKDLAGAFAGALYKAFERQAVRQKIRESEVMAQQQRNGEHATLKPSDVHLVVWRAPESDENSIYSESLYAVLGVSENASDTEIRESWRVLALDTHPDTRLRHPDKCLERSDFSSVMEAFNILRHPWTRRAYDEHLQQRRNNLFFSVVMTALKAAQPLNADAEVEQERRVREVAKTLVQRAQRKGESADKRTRVAVAELSKCRDPMSINKSQYSDRRIAQMVLAWRKEVATSRQIIPTFDGIKATVRGWLQAARQGKFDDVGWVDVEVSTRAGGAPDNHLRTVRKGSGRSVSNDVGLLELHCAKFIHGLNIKKLAVTRAVVLREAYGFNPGMWQQDSPDPVPGTNLPHHQGPCMHRLRTWFKRFTSRCKLSWRATTSVGQKLPSGWE